MKGSRLKNCLLYILLFCIAAAVLFSAAFIFSHLDHDCDGDECPVCLQIETAEMLLKGLGAAGLVLVVVSKFPGKRPLLIPRLFSFYPVTAITLKVQFNN
jgi:hypothetical protein